MNILVPSLPEHFANYKNALKNAHMSPINALSIVNPSDYDGLLLPGGGDMNPALWGETPTGTSAYHDELDNMQIKLAQHFINAGKPILGICKGMQLLNIVFGGTMIEDLPSADIHSYDNGDKFHPSLATPGSFLSNLYGNSFIINSAHHQGCKKIGTDLEIIQICPYDSVVEGFVHKKLPIIGLQWHPERLCTTSANHGAVDGTKIFHYFRFMVRKSILSSSDTR